MNKNIINPKDGKKGKKKKQGLVNQYKKLRTKEEYPSILQPKMPYRAAHYTSRKELVDHIGPQG